MSTKTQKIIRFIPILNIWCVICWFRACFKHKMKMSSYLLDLVKLFALMLGITVVRMVISFAFKNEQVDNIVLYISVYFYLLSMAFVSVMAQERILSEESE